MRRLRIVPPLSRPARTVSCVPGFTLHGIGLVLLSLVIIGSFRRGLV